MDKFTLLKNLGAGDFKHLNGDLETHLTATQRILANWGASENLQTAGLFHAAYGTAGFDDNMVSLEQRQSIAEVIGEEAEALVYLYCACDRKYVFDRLKHASTQQPIAFRDRFSGAECQLTQAQAQSFCELTVANELELVISSETFKQKHGKALLNLFETMNQYLTTMAIHAYREHLRAFS